MNKRYDKWIWQGVGWCLLIFGILHCSWSGDRTEYVKWVIDGDTIVLKNDRHVRYIGINAPEIGRKGKPSEPFSQKARRFNDRMVKAQALRLESDQETQDRYGRLLAYVFLQDHTMINAELLRQGLAYCLPKPPNMRYAERLLGAQREAMQNQRGIWRNFQDPAEGYWGNLRSRRFHRQQCPQAARIAKSNRIFFKKKREAFYQGFAPAKGCIQFP
jgi:micrococcal nuclease